MAEHVCPWWLGHVLASPIRKWWTQNPETLFAPFVRAGMTVLEPGPGMGFFTLPLARMVSPSGRVVAVDIQTKMLAGLERRAKNAGLAERVETRLAKPETMGLADLQGTVDFVLAFAVVHEMPSTETFFREAAAALKPGSFLFLAEPAGHVTPEKFQCELDLASVAGLHQRDRPAVRRCRAAVLQKA
jgi:ubiquinone/menaquinone biosynthesis C-methylase UbiE